MLHRVNFVQIMATIAVFYYTQTGQTFEILKSICNPLQSEGHNVIYKEIIPEPAFDYPWSSKSFFEAFPESREGIACCDIKDTDLSDAQNSDLAIIGWQPWFLSPSIPVHVFLRDEKIMKFLSGRPTITVTGCRNMWITAFNRIKSYLNDSDARLIGNIVLQDRHSNLISVITIIRWLLYGKKEKSTLLPAGGVSDADVENAGRFGSIIGKYLDGKIKAQDLHPELLSEGAIKIKPGIAFAEKNGYKIFGAWSKFILKKGPYGSPRRSLRLTIFKYYLFVVIYLISPVGLLLYYSVYPFLPKKDLTKLR